MCEWLGLEPRDARLFMVTDKRWKFIHAEGETEDGPFRPMLFDLQNDPQELQDLGAGSSHAAIIELMYERLGKWGRRLSQRTTKSEQDIKNMRGKSIQKGITLGYYEASEDKKNVTLKYQGKARKRPDPQK